jgi:uncharacterized membrane protein YfcA
MLPLVDLPPDIAVLFLAVSATFLLAGFVKGVIGLGLPTISMGLLSMVMTPAQAAAILIVPSFMTNIWQIVGPKFPTVLRRLWTMLIGICIGTYAGAGLLTGAENGRAAAALGVALVVYAATGLAGLRTTVPARHEGWLSPLVGAATGAITGATGVFVIPAVPYLQSLAFDKDELVQALGLSFLVSTVALGFSLTVEGIFVPSAIGASVLALAPAFAGMMLGQVVRTRISAAAFKRWFFVGLLVLGGHLALRSGF